MAKKAAHKKSQLKRATEKTGRKKPKTARASSKPNPAPAPRARSRLSGRVFTAIGATLLFSSWLAQNYFESKWAEELQYLEKTQLLIAVEEGRLTQWLVQLNLELQRESPQNDLLAIAATKVVGSTSNLIGWSRARLASGEDQIAPIQQKNDLQDLAENLRATQQTDELVSLAARISSQANAEMGGLLDGFAAKVAEANERSAIWRQRFLTFYILGAITLATGWLVEQRRADRTR